MSEITTGRVEGEYIALDHALTDLDGRRVRVTVEPIEEAAPAEASGDRGERERWNGEAEMRWLREHGSGYVGRWVALDGNRFVAAGEAARDVYAAARAAGVETPFVTLVESDDPYVGGWL